MKALRGLCITFGDEDRQIVRNMAEGTLPYLEQFNAHEDITSVGIRWTKWLKRFENLLVALDMDDKRRQLALLFHYAGPEVADIFDTIPGKDEGKDDEYQSRAVELLTMYTSRRRKILNMKYTCFVKRSKWAVKQ